MVSNSVRRRQALEPRVERIRLPIASGKQLMEANPYFQAFFPPVSRAAGVDSDLKYAPVIDGFVTVTIDNNGQLNGKAKMEASYRDEILEDENGIPLPFEQQMSPSRFFIQANFIDNKLDGDVNIYIFDPDNTNFSITQVLYDEGMILAILYCSIEEFRLDLNPNVELYASLDHQQYGDVNQFIDLYPHLSPDTDWQTKISTASKLAERTIIKRKRDNEEEDNI
jgi:hypothetical protein